MDVVIIIIKKEYSVCFHFYVFVVLHAKTNLTFLTRGFNRTIQIS